MKRIICIFFFLVTIQETTFGVENPASKKYALLFNFGVTGVSFNNGSGMRFGALTPSVTVYKNRYSLQFEYFHFNYLYDGKDFAETISQNKIATQKVDCENFKMAFGKTFGKRTVYINPYLSVNYRKSKLGHSFFDPEAESGGYSPLHALGLGTGLTGNLLILKHLHLSIDATYVRYFDKKNIYKHGTSAKNASTVNNQFPNYQPINNVVYFQAKAGYCFRF